MQDIKLAWWLGGRVKEWNDKVGQGFDPHPQQITNITNIGYKLCSNQQSLIISSIIKPYLQPLIPKR